MSLALVFMSLRRESSDTQDTYHPGVEMNRCEAELPKTFPWTVPTADAELGSVSRLHFELCVLLNGGVLADRRRDERLTTF